LGKTVNCPKSSFFAPFLLIPEVTGPIARQSGQLVLAQQALSFLINLQALQLKEVTPQLGIQAGQIAMNLRIKGADAVYVALAQDLGVPLVTWDREILNRAAGTIQVQTP
jgi:predicted nucleic acid-binding protein